MTTEAIQLRPPIGGLVLNSMEEMKAFALAAYYAGVAGKSENQAEAVAKAVVAMQYGAEVGLGPMQSIQGINVIQGKPTMGAGMIATLVKRSGRYNYRVIEHTDKKCIIQFTENGQPCGESCFTIDDAIKANLTSRNPNWKNVPKNMLFARAISNGAKWYCGDVFSGSVYTPEEIESIATVESNPTIIPKEHVDENGVVHQEQQKSDYWGQPTPQHQPRPQQSEHMATIPQQKKFHAVRRNLGWSDDKARQYLQEMAGVQNTQDVPIGTMSELIGTLVDMQKELKQDMYESWNEPPEEGKREPGQEG